MPARRSGSNTGRTSTICRRAPGTVSGGASRPAAVGAGASAARTYLRPAAKRPNLQIVTGALVHRVMFDGKRAVGVEFSRGGSGNAIERADAAREVILAAGAIGSPHHPAIVGGRRSRAPGQGRHPGQHALPGVGKNFQDHYIARVACSVIGAKTLNEKARGLPFASEVLRYLFTGTGMLTYAPSLVAASVKVLRGIGDPRRPMPVLAGQL